VSRLHVVSKKTNFKRHKPVHCIGHLVSAIVKIDLLDTVTIIVIGP